MRECLSTLRPAHISDVATANQMDGETLTYRGGGVDEYFHRYASAGNVSSSLLRIIRSRNPVYRQFIFCFGPDAQENDEFWP